MPREQQRTTGEGSRCEDGEPHFIIAVYRLQIDFAVKEADTRKLQRGLCLEIKNQFLHLTSCLHSAFKINCGHFSRSERAAQGSLRSQRSSQLRGNTLG